VKYIITLHASNESFDLMSITFFKT